MIHFNFEGENVFLPVFIDCKKVQFTNLLLHELSSGDDYFLVKINDKKHFFKYCYEPDCDGAYYSYYIYTENDFLKYCYDEQNFEVVEVYKTNILKTLTNLF